MLTPPDPEELTWAVPAATPALTAAENTPFQQSMPWGGIRQIPRRLRIRTASQAG